MRSPRQISTFIRLMKKYLVARDGKNLADLLDNSHPADTAQILEKFDRGARELFFQVVPPEMGAQIWQELDLQEQLALLGKLAVAEAAPILNSLPADELVDLLAEIPRDRARALLPYFDDTLAIRKLLQYAPDSAGGRMTTEFLAFAADTLSGDCIQDLRSAGPDIETIYYLYVVSAEGKLLGTVSLRDLLAADKDQTLKDIMVTDVVTSREDADQEAVVELLARYGLLAIPIVDDDGILLGIVTVDDAFEILEDERAEDLALISGLTFPPRSVTRPAGELLGGKPSLALRNGIPGYLGAFLAMMGLSAVGGLQVGPLLLLAAAVASFMAASRSRTAVWLWSTGDGGSGSLGRVVLGHTVLALALGLSGAAGSVLGLWQVDGGQALAAGGMFLGSVMGGAAAGLGLTSYMIRKGDPALLSDLVLLILAGTVAGVIYLLTGSLQATP